MNVNDKSRATVQRNRIPGIHIDTFHIFIKFEFIMKFKFDQTDIMNALVLEYFYSCLYLFVFEGLRYRIDGTVTYSS